MVEETIDYLKAENAVLRTRLAQCANGDYRAVEMPVGFIGADPPRINDTYERYHDRKLLRIARTGFRKEETEMALHFYSEVWLKDKCAGELRYWVTQESVGIKDLLFESDRMGMLMSLYKRTLKLMAHQIVEHQFKL